MPSILLSEGSAIAWLESGGDATLSLSGLSTSTARQGDLVDLGASPRPRKYAWRLWVKPTSSVGSGSLSVYMKTSNGTHPDIPGTTDGNTTAYAVLRVLRQQTGFSGSSEMVLSGVVEIEARYFAPVVLNTLGVDLSGTPSDHGFSLMPVPDSFALQFCEE